MNAYGANLPEHFFVVGFRGKIGICAWLNAE